MRRRYSPRRGTWSEQAENCRHLDFSFPSRRDGPALGRARFCARRVAAAFRDGGSCCRSLRRERARRALGRPFWDGVERFENRGIAVEAARAGCHAVRHRFARRVCGAASAGLGAASGVASLAACEEEEQAVDCVCLLFPSRPERGGPALGRARFVRGGLRRRFEMGKLLVASRGTRPAGAGPSPQGTAWKDLKIAESPWRPPVPVAAPCGIASLAADGGSVWPGGGTAADCRTALLAQGAVPMGRQGRVRITQMFFCRLPRRAASLRSPRSMERMSSKLRVLRFFLPVPQGRASARQSASGARRFAAVFRWGRHRLFCGNALARWAVPVGDGVEGLKIAESPWRPPVPVAAPCGVASLAADGGSAWPGGGAAADCGAALLAQGAVPMGR